jgi:hypothetical protein
VDELADAAGGHVDYGDGGMATVDFTGRGAPEIPAFSTTPVTVSREVAHVPAPTENVLARAETSEAAPEASTSVSTPHSSSIPEQDGAPAAPDPDEIYEQVMTRLRRDLIAELEQNGHLLRETL